MVSNVTLTQIHMRLVEIFKPESPETSFANQNIFLLGDLLQVIILYKLIIVLYILIT